MQESSETHLSFAPVNKAKSFLIRSWSIKLNGSKFQKYKISIVIAFSHYWHDDKSAFGINKNIKVSSLKRKAIIVRMPFENIYGGKHDKLNVLNLTNVDFGAASVIHYKMLFHFITSILNCYENFSDYLSFFWTFDQFTICERNTQTLKIITWLLKFSMLSQKLCMEHSMI